MGDIGPILGALGIKALRWPGMGSNIAFEVWLVLARAHLSVQRDVNSNTGEHRIPSSTFESYIADMLLKPFMALSTGFHCRP